MEHPAEHPRESPKSIDDKIEGEKLTEAHDEIPAEAEDAIIETLDEIDVEIPETEIDFSETDAETGPEIDWDIDVDYDPDYDY